MKFIISPAKQMKFTDLNIEASTPIFEKDATKIASQINNLTVLEIMKAYKINENMATQVKEKYLHFNEIKHPAIAFYNGLQYKNINLQELNEDQLKFLVDNLYIADALYGLLRASDEICEYRMDYKTKLSFYNKNYYKEKINSVIDEKIINLCSQEFSEILNDKNLINVHFKQNVKGIIKSYSTHTKIARGKFINYLAKKQKSDLKTIKSFNEENYILDEINSDESNIYFIRN